MLKAAFQVMARGEDIHQYGLDRPPIHVTHSLFFEEIQARTESGLSLTEWEALPGTPDWITPDGPQLSKCHVVAYQRLKSLIEAVFITEQRRKSS